MPPAVPVHPDDPVPLIRPARSDDVAAVRSVARGAGERFREIAEARIARCADDPPPSIDHLFALIDNGQLLVAEQGGVVVGFVAVAPLDGRAHVEEISVVPTAQGRGHGVALLVAAEHWAVRRGLDGLTLTTFRDVPWNRPFYERRGFCVLDDEDLTVGLRALMVHESSLGLDPELRVAMGRPRAAASP